MTMQLSEIAALVGGRLVGDGARVCTGASPLGDRNRGHVTLLEDARKSNLLKTSDAAAVIVPTELADVGLAQVIVDDVHQAFAKIVASFRPRIDCQLPESGIDSTAQVSPSASIHPSVIVGAGARIGERTRILPGAVIMSRCEIGNDCVIHANVTLYEYTQIGDRVVIHSGCVFGANGFGYRQENGRHVPTAQLGYVAIESDVEIGASVTIDRGTYGATRVGEGTKIDNQVMIGHNCQIGRHNLLCSQVGIAGSCRTGDYVIMAGQVGLADHINIGDHAVIGAQAGVMDDCPGDQVYLGSPATPQREQMQIMAVQRRLPEMRRGLKQLRRDVDQLKPSSDSHDQRAA